MPQLNIQTNTGATGPFRGKYFTITGQTAVMAVPAGSVVRIVFIDGLMLAQSDWSYNATTKVLTINNVITGTAWGFIFYSV